MKHHASCIGKLRPSFPGKANIRNTLIPNGLIDLIGLASHSLSIFFRSISLISKEVLMAYCISVARLGTFLHYYSFRRPTMSPLITFFLFFHSTVNKTLDHHNWYHIIGINNRRLILAWLLKRSWSTLLNLMKVFNSNEFAHWFTSLNPTGLRTQEKGPLRAAVDRNVFTQIYAT